MKLKDAQKIIKNKEKAKGTGFMVSFEVKKGGILASDHFPDKHAGEKLIPTEEEVWDLAGKFARATDENYVNIYVVDHTFNPVKGYDSRKLKSY
jgi:hypothetical protein